MMFPAKVKLEQFINVNLYNTNSLILEGKSFIAPAFPFLLKSLSSNAEFKSFSAENDLILS